MYWILSFKTKKDSIANEMEGFDVRSVRIFTSSFLKRQELIEKYKNEGYSLVNLAEEEEDIPNGYENRAILQEYWFPNLEECRKKYLSYGDLSDDFLKEAPPKEKEFPKIAIPATEKTSSMKSGTKVCIHKFNCEAHRDICVAIHGLPPIYTKPVLKGDEL